MNRPEAAIYRVLAWLESGLDQTITLERAAEIADYSPYHFGRIFQNHVGESFYTYVKRLRLETGAFLIKTKLSVTDSAFASGYQTHEAFTRAFRSQFGLPPSAMQAGLTDETCSDRYLELPRRVTFEGVDGHRVRIRGPYEQTGRPGSPGYWPESADRCFGISWDDPDITEPAKIRYDAVWTGAATKDSQPFRIEPCDCIAAVHHSSFETLAVSYRYLLYVVPFHWNLKVHELKPPFEEFLSDGKILIRVPLAF